MRRVQIQLDNPTYEVIRKRAFRERKSFSATAREILVNAVAPAKKKRRLEDFTFIGAGSSGTPGSNVAENHDDVLGEGRW